MKKRGMGSHHPGSHQGITNVWLTPPHVLKALGSFDLDPCACSEPRPWDTAKRMIVRAEDGLKALWSGRVWLNPPYGDEATVWLDRLAHHGTGTALVFARTETAMWHDSIWPRAAGVLFLKGRLHFHRPDGARADANGGAPSALIAYGRHDADVLGRCGLAGAFIDLERLRTAARTIPMRWRAAVLGALAQYGGEATLQELYASVQRPTDNPHWREQVRKQVQEHAHRTGRGRYSLSA